jgi:hypothetical protein
LRIWPQPISARPCSVCARSGFRRGKGRSRSRSDSRYPRCRKANLAEYHVPVHADLPSLEALMTTSTTST